jgi:hypothetical protein
MSNLHLPVSHSVHQINQISFLPDQANKCLLSEKPLNVYLITPSMLIVCFYNIALKEDTDIQADEDKSSPDEVTSQVSSNHTETPNVSQDVNQNTTMDLMHSCPQDTKL